MESKRPSFDEMMDVPLEKISAADLLEAMVERPEVAQAITILPEKKKAELETEPLLPKVRLADLVKRLRGEKKKVEYELGPWLDPSPQPNRPQATVPLGRLQEWKKAAYEVDDFYGARVINPAVMDSLISQLEERLVARLQKLVDRG